MVRYEYFFVSGYFWNDKALYEWQDCVELTILREEHIIVQTEESKYTFCNVFYISNM